MNSIPDMPRNFTSEDFNQLSLDEQTVLKLIKYSDRGFLNIQSISPEFTGMSSEELMNIIESLKEQALIVEHQPDYFQIEREDIHFAIEDATRLNS